MAVQWLRLYLPVQELQIRSLVRELRSHMVVAKNPNINRSNIVTNSIKTLKMVPHQKSLKKKLKS